jgi:heme exporter protein A
MLTVENLSFEKNYKKIFANLGFSIGLGSALIITGKNGSGKSSLLKIIAGINNINTESFAKDLDNEDKSQLNQGKILWSGQDINDFRDEFNSDLEYLGHKIALRGNLTVVENLSFYARLKDSEILVPAALSYFNLEKFADSEVRKLSAGWQKKVFLAKLLCCPATIWLLDEPSNNLDHDSKEKLYNLIYSKIKNNGLAIITTHDQIFCKLGPVLNIEDYTKNGKI